MADRRRRGRPRASRSSPLGMLVAGLPLRRRGDVRDRPARRQRARGPAADDHARAGRRRARARRARARWSSGCQRGRDARRDHGDLHRQDRDADREPDARWPLWTAAARSPAGDGRGPAARPRSAALAAARGRVQHGRVDPAGDGAPSGDPPRWRCSRPRAALGADVDAGRREPRRRARVPLRPAGCKLMTTVDDGRRRPLGARQGRARTSCSTRCDRDRRRRRRRAPLDDARAIAAGARAVEGMAARGLRVLAVARRRAPGGRGAGGPRGRRARSLPPRAGGDARPAAAGGARRGGALPRAGIRIVVVTGDNGLTAAAVAREVGIVRGARARGDRRRS